MYWKIHLFFINRSFNHI